MYYSFIKNCCIIDVKAFNSNNQTTYTNFNKYIISLYSINIYVQCLNDLITLFIFYIIDPVPIIDPELYSAPPIFNVPSTIIVPSFVTSPNT